MFTIDRLCNFPILLQLLTNPQNQPTCLRSSQSINSDFRPLQRSPRANTIPLIMNMLDFILIVKQTNIIKLLNISLKKIIRKILYILKYLTPQLLDRLLNIIIFLRHIRFKKKSLHR